jgi:hypothetical protein
MPLRRHDSISGTTQEPLARRLWRDMSTQLAERLGCCPRHGTPLICAFCDVDWTGSAGEKLAVEALVEGSCAVQGVTWPTWRCGRCGTQDVALCLDCYEPIREQAFAGLTPAEEARLGELLRRHMRYTCRPDPEAAGKDQQSHEGEGNS